MQKDVAKLSPHEAADELAQLAKALSAANAAYHTHDAPDLSDADYDALKRRNKEIEAHFPNLKRADSPSERVGGAVAEGFQKTKHSVPMLSLGNAFDHADVTE